MAPITLKVNYDKFKKTNIVLPSSSPINVESATKTNSYQTPRQPLPLRSGPEKQSTFPYHIDEDNEVIYKMADNGTWRRWTGREEREQESEKLVKWAEVPQTLAFNYDWSLVKLAAETKNSTLRGLLYPMLVLRELHDIADFPTYMSRVSHHGKSEEPKPPYSAKALLNDDGSYSRWTNWDYLLRDVKHVSNVMKARRRWKMARVKKVAKWSKWARARMINIRTEFVDGRGYTIERVLEQKCAPDTKWKIELGYRRAVDTLWSGVHGPWNPETQTEVDKAVIAQRISCSSHDVDGTRRKGQGIAG